MNWIDIDLLINALLEMFWNWAVIKLSITFIFASRKILHCQRTCSLCKYSVFNFEIPRSETKLESLYSSKLIICKRIHQRWSKRLNDIRQTRENLKTCVNLFIYLFGYLYFLQSCHINLLRKKKPLLRTYALLIQYLYKDHILLVQLNYFHTIFSGTPQFNLFFKHSCSFVLIKLRILLQKFITVLSKNPIG